MTPPHRAWVERVTGSPVVRSRPLHGGTTSAMHRIRLADGRSLVLRRWVGGRYDLSDDEKRHLARNEAVTLDVLAGTDIPAPRLVAVDETGEAAGAPATLSTLLPGRVDLRPRDVASWVTQLAAWLPRIHAVRAAERPFEAWYDPATRGMNGGTWDDAAEVAAYVEGPAVFLHRDYQHFNVLWSRGRLTGIVDWTSSCSGHPDVDVGHCRLNLAVLFSAELAARFLERYEAEAGRCVDPRVDLAELLCYDERWHAGIAVQAIGIDVDRAGMTERVRATVEASLRRAG